MNIATSLSARLLRAAFGAAAQFTARLNSGWASPPTGFSILVNRECGMTCQMCDWGQRALKTDYLKNLGFEPDSELDWRILKSLIEQVGWRKPYMSLVGAEPLGYSHLEGFLKLTHQVGIDVSITTNGYLLEEKADLLARYPVSSVTVSIDGPPDIHNDIRGVSDSFQRAAAGIRCLTSLRRGPSPSINIVSTVHNLNAAHLTATLESLADLPINLLVFSHFTFVTPEMAAAQTAAYKEFPATIKAVDRRVSNTEVDVDLLWDQIEQIRKTRAPFPVIVRPDLNKEELRIYYHDPTRIIPAKQRPKNCQALYKSACVNVSGEIVAYFYKPFIPIGNLKITSLIDMWNSREMRRIRRDYRSGQLMPACLRCPNSFI